MVEKLFDRASRPDRQREKEMLIQHLEDAQALSDALDMHLCAALIDQALRQAREE